MNKLSLIVRVALVLLLMPLISYAAIDAHEFENLTEQHRYQALLSELRCPKCQNQNLSDSDSQIAIDLRNAVYRLLKEGRSDDEIKTYLVNRYGDFVLYRPPVQSNTLVLWWAPVVMLGIGALVFVYIVVTRRKYIAKLGDDSEEGSD